MVLLQLLHSLEPRYEARSTETVLLKQLGANDVQDLVDLKKLEAAVQVRATN